MPPTCIDLPDPGRRDAQIGLLYAMQQELRERLLKAIAELTPSQMVWVPEDGGNSIGMIVLHIAEAELFWMQYVGTGNDLTPEQKAEFRTTEFGDPKAPPLPEKPVGWFSERLHEARRTTQTFYATLADAALHDRRPFVDDEGREYEFSLRWIIYHLLEHEAGHRGQILTLRRRLMERGIA